MRLKAALKDWRRRRLLRRAGIAVEVDLPQFTAGARSGVWVVDPTHLGPDSVVYSVGVGDNIAWDLAMIARFGCLVHAFDPTPRARAWIERQPLPPQFAFWPLALAGSDREVSFAEPRRDRDVNYRPLPPGSPPVHGRFSAPAERLATIAGRLGHRRIDVLKLDVEGGEYEVLDDLLAGDPATPEIDQLLVEFHHGERGIPFAATAAAVGALRRAGFRLFHSSRRGLELSFAQRR
ncbi:MAG: FkbM family methyltransferase [Planctomycetota bacterium]